MNYITYFSQSTTWIFEEILKNRGFFMNRLLRFLWISILIGMVWPMSAQNGGLLSGIIQDSTTQEGVVGAVIEAAPKANPDQKKYQTSTLDGKFSFTGLSAGEYTLTISFLGYKTLTYPVKLGRRAFNTGVILLQPEAKELEEVVAPAPAEDPYPWY